MPKVVKCERQWRCADAAKMLKYVKAIKLLRCGCRCQIMRAWVPDAVTTSTSGTSCSLINPALRSDVRQTHAYYLHLHQEPSDHDGSLSATLHSIREALCPCPLVFEAQLIHAGLNQPGRQSSTYSRAVATNAIRRQACTYSRENTYQAHRMRESISTTFRRTARRLLHSGSSPRPSIFTNPWILGGTVFLQTFCLVHYVVANFWSIERARGPSMLPTMSVWGDWILHDHTCRLGRGVGVGDLVSYKLPIVDGQIGVKRIIGMPGDYVLLGTPGERGQDKMVQVRVIHLSLFINAVSDLRRATGPTRTLLSRG